jgi:hypothetical protein
MSDDQRHASQTPRSVEPPVRLPIQFTTTPVDVSRNPQPHSSTAASPTTQPTGNGNSESSSIITPTHRPATGSVENNPSPSNVTTDTPEENERRFILRQLDSVVSQFRNKEVNKAKAITTISGILVESNSLSENEEEKTLDLYLREIESYAKDLVEQGTSKGKRRSDESETQKISDKIINQNVDTFLEHVSNRSNDDFGGSDDDEEGNHGRKRRRIKESEMPWYDSSKTTVRNSSCEKTYELLMLYERDYSRCKFLAKSAIGAPHGFPTSQWDRIFRGEPVDLDQVASALFRYTLIEERTTRVGDAKISLGVAEPTRKVKSQSDWAAAWNFAVKAYKLAFPHRYEELQSYSDYIQGIFSSKDESVHSSIISFDIGIRNHVGGGQSVLLTDTQEFSGLYNAIVMSDGVAFQSHGSSGKRSKNPRASTATKSEICNKFNAGDCRNSDSECKYKHTCKNCKQSGHGKHNCPK